MKPLAYLLLFLVSNAGAGTLYKCEVGGSVTYQDAPCNAGKSSEVTLSLAKKRQKEVEKQSGNNRDVMVKVFSAVPAWKEAIDRKTVLLGMPRTLAHLIKGDPTSVNRTTTARGTREQWVYRSGSSASYIYIQDGQVVALQD